MTSGSRRYDLYALLDTYAPEPSEERARREMMLLVGNRNDPFSRYLYEPGHFTASACVLSPARDAVLLVHHIRLDKWLQPGGHIDPVDPSVVAAAVRETVEETGASVSGSAAELFDIDVHHIPAAKGEPPHAHFDLRFLITADGVDLVPQPSEVNDARWVPFGDARMLSREGSLLRMVAKATRRAE